VVWDAPSYWAGLQSVHGLRCYGNITRTLVTIMLLASIPRYDDARRSVRALLAGDWRVTGAVLKIARRIWEVGVASWPVTGRRL